MRRLTTISVATGPVLRPMKGEAHILRAHDQFEPIVLTAGVPCDITVGGPRH